MPQRRKARIALARVETPDGGDLAAGRSAMDDAFVPGTGIERYGRVWRMGAVSFEGKPVLYYQGRIGYQRAAGTTELFDEETRDFTPAAIIEGASSSFALDVRTMIVAFQLRPGKIKRTSFTGAFAELLQEGSQRGGWAVTALREEATFEQFVERVDAITELRVRLKKPNPDWSGRKRLRQVFEDANAEVMDIVWRSSADAGGVDTGAEIVRQAIQHSYERRYGHVVAHGTESDQDIKYDSRTDTAPPELQVPADPRGEASWPSLREATKAAEEFDLRGDEEG